MRKISLTRYTVKVRNRDSDELVNAPYDVKVSLVSVLFHPNLQLKAMELLERDRLANKINDCKNGFVLLEESEYEKVTQSLDKVTGFMRNDVEFVRRVKEAEEVQVEEKPKK